MPVCPPGAASTLVAGSRRPVQGRRAPPRWPSPSRRRPVQGQRAPPPHPPGGGPSRGSEAPRRLPVQGGESLAAVESRRGLGERTALAALGGGRSAGGATARRGRGGRGLATLGRGGGATLGWGQGLGRVPGWRLGRWEPGTGLGLGVRRNEGNPKDLIYIKGMGSTCQRVSGLRVRISNFQIRYKIPVGFRVVPAPTPAGTNPDPNPRPAGRVSADLRVFCTRCHLIPKATLYLLKDSLTTISTANVAKLIRASSCSPRTNRGKRHDSI